MSLYLRLFWEFFKTGLFSVGGGMATLPFLKNIAVRTGWYTFSDLADMVAVSESTPGPMGVNMATYVGFKTGGIPGGVIATLGLILPSIIVILIIATVLDKFRKNKYVDAAFYGLRPASVGLIAAAGVGIVLIAFFRLESIYKVVEGVHVELKHVILAVVLYILTNNVKQTKKLHPAAFILFSAVVGIVFSFAS